MADKRLDRRKLKFLPLRLREHKMVRGEIHSLDYRTPPERLSAESRIATQELATAIAKAAREKKEVVWIMGAHAIRRGNSRFIIDLISRGVITHVVTNMAAAIHDFELASIGATCEDVERYIRDGTFGHWEETCSSLNTAVTDGDTLELGLGEAIARRTEQESGSDISVFAAAYRACIPIGIAKGIGYDITDQHPSADFSALGRTSGRDFLELAETLTQLVGGVVVMAGSAVMGPEVYLKALSMARNIARRDGDSIHDFTTGVLDIVPLGNWRQEEHIVDFRKPGTLQDPRYYFRPMKSVLVRTVRDGGVSHYISGDFADTVPYLYERIVSEL